MWISTSADAAGVDSLRPSVEARMLLEAIRSDVEILWRYHDLGHTPRRCDVGIGLGSHDLGVAIVAADMYRREMFPIVLFSGANSPTTIGRFPGGEAVAYREYAIAHGVPADAVLVESEATNTAENFTLSQALLAEHGIEVGSVMVMSRPYQQRRAFATCRKLWPEVDVVCRSMSMSLDNYVASIGDVRRVVDMLVGDTQRIEVYAQRGFAIAQDVPAEVHGAYERLVEAGFTSRLV